MRIERLEATGFAGLKSMLFDPEARASIITAQNNQGKSSFRDALQFLLTGLARGIEKKKDAGILATGKPCKVTGSIDGMEISRTPAGCSVAEAVLEKRFGKPAMIAALLDAFRFVEMKAAERRELVQALTADPEKIRTAIQSAADAAGLSPTEAAELMDLADSPKGLNGAEALAVDRRREAKREAELEGTRPAPTAIATIAGEDYDLGQATVQAIAGQLQEREQARKVLLAKRDELLKGYGPAKVGGSAEDARKAIEKIESELFTLGKPPTNDELAKVRGQGMKAGQGLELAKKALTEAEAAYKLATGRYQRMEKLKGAGEECPTCGHRMTAKEKEEALAAICKEGEAAAEKKRKAQLAVDQAAKELDGTRVQGDKLAAEMSKHTDLMMALDGERAALKAAEGFAEVEQQLQALDEDLEKVESSMRTGQLLKVARESYDRQLEAAREAQGKAGEAVKRIDAWDRAAKALGKDGNIRRLAASGFSPADVLEHAARLLPGRQVVIGDEWDITVDGCPAIRLSRSERWRLGAAFAASLALKSGLRFMVLDEADLLDDENRPVMMGWLEDLAKATDEKGNAHYDSIIVIGTGRRPPEPPADGWLDCWHLEDGRLFRLVPTASTQPAQEEQ